ncbi:MAG TPA: serine/threonine-protein kinase [Sphingomicrobium sp.]|nr:serine/threonine-protein kinase [Sphingomicrobium sp.]
MNKVYSNKALPAGTVLREWRLEEVLGVGGFGIVYKARGIYFNELVAIKEYFPSSTSERDSDDTVVPIDSNAEEVHALGLKKFVEEAKLLWNLSTPSRHPNIVSVRSLFEIHGTAYMVMDFEDGVSLSKMLKQGRRFNERSLWNILHPIAEGLDRAHRVGVLHRDIKPPNILITEDNRPVLIDFGSARFEAAEATSTKVTFHTPPYAAIEQYVKTYAQGPWTDIYALGVVMYECVTGEKPAEVLERLHAGLGKPLAEGKWPGYSKRFLAAVDAAMVVKPDERPQSIGDWLPMFGRETTAAPEDDEATRFYTKQVEADAIVPVPPTPNIDPKAPVETGVPADPKEAKFKRAGEETGASKKLAAEKAAAKEAEKDSVESAEESVVSETAAPAPDVRKLRKTADESRETKRKLSPMVLGGAAAAVLAVVAVGAMTLGGGGSQSGSDASQIGPATSDDSGAIAALGPESGTVTDTTLTENQSLATDETAPAAPDPAAEALR